MPYTRTLKLNARESIIILFALSDYYHDLNKQPEFKELSLEVKELIDKNFWQTTLEGKENEKDK